LSAKRNFRPKNWRESEPLKVSPENELRLMNDARAKLDDFFSAFSGAANPLLLLDYDGTLAPFRVDRFQALPWSGVRDLLNQIQNQGQTRIVVVTGRPAAEILPLLGVEPAPEVWGLHGAERLYADGRRELEQLSPETRDKLDAVSVQLRRESESTGGLIEIKPNAVVMHWRGVSPARAKIIEKHTRALFEPLAQKDGLGLLEFEAGLELRAGRDKGGAVTAILDEAAGADPQTGPHQIPNPAACPAAFLGDDLTDEVAFRAIKNYGNHGVCGLGLLVRRQFRPTDAEVWLRPPEDLRHFLNRWFHACAHLQSNLYDPLLYSR
jgi:trehalose 6-phosphate phosphatase